MDSEFFALHGNQIVGAIVIFVVSLVVSSLAGLFVILRLPENHFHAGDRGSVGLDRPRWQRVLGMIVKNAIGVGLVVLGLVMTLPGVPGQGLLTMFIGVVLLDLPGKRALERRIIARPTIFHACNRLRLRFGKKPFTLAAELPSTNEKAIAETLDAQDGDDYRRK
jgi:hypothetical protein